MRCGKGASGEFLLTAGAALAIEISRQLTADELELLSAFLEVLGDQLALLALNTPQGAGADGTQAAADCPRRGCGPNGARP